MARRSTEQLRPATPYQSRNVSQRARSDPVLLSEEPTQSTEWPPYKPTCVLFFEVPEGAAVLPLPVDVLQSDQLLAVNRGLPPVSLICAAHTFWTAFTTLSGIGT